ncbi:MAG: DUF4340 domain-containing protein [Gammaproteobacteria bacterium]|nr:DUF4340 domain-containing protein [Gammaproteobacteria bacterium]
MSGRVGMLATLMGLQLLLIAVFGYLGFAESAAPAPGFLEFVAEDVDRLVIAGDGEEVAMDRDEEGWHLAGGTPADGDKIDGVLNKLEALDARWPVATSEGSRQRFEVTAESNQRHIQIYVGGDTVAELYLGTSPGYRRVHARAAGAEEVFSVDFANFEVPVAQDDWLDKDLLRAVGGVTEVIREGAWTLSKAEQGWMIAAPALEQDAADPDAAENLVKRITDLRVAGFAPEQGNLSDSGTFTITDEAGSYQLRIYHDDPEDSYAVESDRVAGRFSLATYIAEQVLVNQQDLRVSLEAEEPAPAG